MPVTDELSNICRHLVPLLLISVGSANRFLATVSLVSAPVLTGETFKSRIATVMVWNLLILSWPIMNGKNSIGPVLPIFAA
jgi:hypothetical protein